jgi:hypothetical protein
MREMVSALVIAAALVLASGTAGAQCTKDTDCKGDRVCRSGQCVDAAGPGPAAPPSPAAPKAVREGPLSFFQTGYASVAVLFAFHGWGASVEEYDGVDRDSDLESDFAAVVRLAGYAAISESFHVGGAWTFLNPDLDVDPEDVDDYDVDMAMNMLGASLKFGSALAERVWLGAAVDVGVLFFKGEVDNPFGGDLEMKAMIGLALHPQAELDVLIVDTGSFRLAFLASLGLLAAPIAGGHPYDDDDFDEYVPEGDEIDVRFWWLSPMLMLGLAAGA